MTTITVKANQLSLGGFTGTLTSTVSSGFSMRTGSNDCKLIAGTSLAPDGTLEDRSSFTSHVGYHPDNGNGGCNDYETDAYGNTSSKAIERVNSNQDDGKLNFGNGDIFHNYYYTWDLYRNLYDRMINKGEEIVPMWINASDIETDIID